MGHGATKSGKYYNGCTEADVNKGCYGKLSSAQISERIDLHARRKIEGKPSVVEIANHWMEKYGIEMTYQSEKQWCNTAKNSEMIEARREEMQRSGELVRPTMSAQTLINSLAEAARDNAENCKNLKARLNSAINGDCTPWSILGMAEHDYFNLIGPKRKDADAKVEIIIEARKNALKLAVEYSKAHINMSKEFRQSVKQTYDMGKYMGMLDDTKSVRKRLNEDTRAEIEDLRAGETIAGGSLDDIDVDEARRELGYDDN